MSNVPATPLPLPFVLGGFGLPLPNLVTNFQTVKTVLQQPTQTLQKGWDRLQHTKHSWHTLGWLTQDYADALRHLVFFTTPSALLKRRKARAVRSLQLYEQEDSAGKKPTTKHTTFCGVALAHRRRSETSIISCPDQSMAAAWWASCACQG